MCINICIYTYVCWCVCEESPTTCIVVCLSHENILILDINICGLSEDDSSLSCIILMNKMITRICCTVTRSCFCSQFKFMIIGSQNGSSSFILMGELH